MGSPSVTFSGTEVALVAGMIAISLPSLSGSDFEVADLMLDKALAAIPRPISPALEDHIARLRYAPAERVWLKLITRVPAGRAFDAIGASIATGVGAALVNEYLEELKGMKSSLLRVDDHHWTIKP